MDGWLAGHAGMPVLAACVRRGKQSRLLGMSAAALSITLRCTRTQLTSKSFFHSFSRHSFTWEERKAPEEKWLLLGIFLCGCSPRVQNPTQKFLRIGGGCKEGEILCWQGISKVRFQLWKVLIQCTRYKTKCCWKGSVLRVFRAWGH
jgi:hypothetical protein